MSIVKKTDNWGYSVDRSSSNWTGRVPRQSRITGEWRTYRVRQRRIPKSAYVGAALFVALICLANFL